MDAQEQEKTEDQQQVEAQQPQKKPSKGKGKAKVQPEETPTEDGVVHGVDLESLDWQQLSALQKQVDQALKDRDKQRRDEALAEMQEVAARHGLSLRDLQPAQKPNKPKTPPKYRHPENPALTWTGKGRKPRWYREYMAAGGAETDLRIQ